MDDKDKEIIKGIIEKDHKALECFILKHGSMIYNVVSSVLNNSHERDSIDECINDILLCLWDNMDCFSVEKGNFKSWLICISKNKALDYKRKLVKSLDSTDIEDVQISSQSDIEENYISQEESKQLACVLDELGQKDSEIFKRKYLNDESVEEISKNMGMSTMSIYKRLSRGRRKLRKLMEKI
ncbi:sigma-70 family RNA polymerase sigma factor [Clostridium amazonitimonense]|uniref:sigma-70 family RNA polymerase sigma factor n=1 Tax=Clostridium amazonitimonense TaxID=1499689 RepID=UPI000509C5E2|nr:sigma-70 family RNA polymerase sigma factor [Clostridium amazonitimonense]